MTPAQFKTARKALGMTQAQIAAFLGVRNTSTIRRWEHGQVPIPQTVGMVFERDAVIAALEADVADAIARMVKTERKAAATQRALDALSTSEPEVPE